MDYDEYSDITFFELTYLIEGYNVREEERIWPIRKLYTLLYNVNVDKASKSKSEIDLWPFPSEYKLYKLRKEDKKNLQMLELEKALKGDQIVKTKRN